MGVIKGLLPIAGGGEGGGVGKIYGETRVVLKILLNQPLPPHLIINDSSLIRI